MHLVSRLLAFTRPSGAALIVATIAAGALGVPSAVGATGSDHRALVLSGHAVNNTVVVRGTATDAGTYSINGGRPRRFDGIRSLTIRGHGGHDVCRIINPRSGLLAPPGGIWCDGGNQPGQPRRGVLVERGGRGATGSYRPGAVAGSGTIIHRSKSTRQVIHFTGLAPVTDTVSASSFTFNAPLSSDDVGLVSSNVASGIWTVESLSHPGGWETDTFSNKGVVTINATASGESVTLAPVSPEAGLTQLVVNAGGSIAVVGMDVGSTPVALNAGGTITGAGPSPQLVANGVAAVAPNGIGPLTTSVGGFAGTSTNGSIELHDSGSLAAGAALNQLSQTGISAGRGVTISSAGTLTNDGAISGTSVSLSASALDLTHGSVSAPAVTLAPVTSGGALALGGSGGSGTLGIGQASLSTIQTSALTIGGPSTGTTTVAGPVNVSAPELTLEGTGGFGASGSGAITAAGSLTFSDDGAVGRPWAIGPASVADGVGSPIPYTASSLTVDGGSGSDTFDVTPSTTTPMQVDGGGSSGDSLTLEAGGAVVTGAAQPPQGDLLAAGHAAVRYSSIEQVRVANPGQPTSTTPTPAPAPSCSLLAPVTRVTIGRAHKPRRAPLALLAACSQTARASVSGTLTVIPRAAHGSHHRPKTSRITLQTRPVSIHAGKITAITVTIPPAALIALRAGARESLKLTLTATAGTHTTRATVRVKKLTH